MGFDFVVLLMEFLVVFVFVVGVLCVVDLDFFFVCFFVGVVCFVDVDVVFVL